jgi:hypothetical protein
MCLDMYLPISWLERLAFAASYLTEPEKLECYTALYKILGKRTILLKSIMTSNC